MIFVTQDEIEKWQVGPFTVTYRLVKNEDGVSQAEEWTCTCDHFQRHDHCKHVNWVSLQRAGPEIKQVR